MTKEEEIYEEIERFGEAIPPHLRHLREIIMAPSQPLSEGDLKIGREIADKFENGEYHFD